MLGTLEIWREIFSPFFAVILYGNALGGSIRTLATARQCWKGEKGMM